MSERLIGLVGIVVILGIAYALSSNRKAINLRIVGAALLSGIANGVLLTVINSAAENVANSALQVHEFFVYIVGYLLFLYTLRFSLQQASVAIEEASCNSRLRITDKLRRVDLAFIERKGRGELFTRLTKDNEVMSQGIPVLVGAAQALILIVISKSPDLGSNILPLVRHPCEFELWIRALSRSLCFPFVCHFTLPTLL